MSDLTKRVLGSVLIAFATAFTFGCAALQNITPADRAAAYERDAAGMSVLCKAYRFDRASGLSDAAPKMAKACEAVP